jgi:Raf kinase inhibitor-like YbhB/YbcL family protein
MELRSDAFKPGGRIPVTYSKDGQEISPPLRWSEVPPEARELALLFENTTEPFVQWLVYKIPADLDRLPAGFRHQAEPDEPARVVQGINSQGNIGYDGPLGAEGRRYRYAFRLFALDKPLDVPPKLDKPALLKAIEAHVLAEATLHAVYERPRD